MGFQDELKLFLRSEKIIFSEKNVAELTSKFPFLFLNKHKILLHCISIHYPFLNTISKNYLSDLSDNAAIKNIKLIHLWEDVWHNNKPLVKSRLLALCGVSKRIHARQTKVERLHKKESEQFLNANHLQQNTNAYFKYGLYKNDELVAVATFSKSRVMTDCSALYRSYELVRFASLCGTTVIGGLSKLLNYFIKHHHPAHLMTYADRDWSSGSSYKKMGFVFKENTVPQEFFIHPNEMIRFYPHRLPTKFSSINEMINAGYIKIYNAGNAKFILDRRIS